MKRYAKELIAAILQLFMFYIFPFFAGPTDVIAMVLLILLATLILSFVLGLVSNNSLKYLYPLFTAIIFVPTVFIHYNESAFVHSVWYLVVSSVGMAVGSAINVVVRKLKRKS